MVEYVEGDMFNPDWGLDAVGHGCNAQGVMGLGVAADIRNRYPGILRAYQRALNDGVVLGEFHLWSASAHQIKWVYNLITQPVPGACADTLAITEAVVSMVRDAQRRKFTRVGVPLLGGGIGGLRYEEALNAIAAAAPTEGACTLVVFTKFLKGVGRPITYDGAPSARTTRDLEPDK